MALASNPNENILFGKGILKFKKSSGSGYIHLGEAPVVEVLPAIEKTSVYSSMSGIREKLMDVVTQKGGTVNFDLIEYNVQNLDLAFMSDGAVESSQSASYLDFEEVTIADDLYVDIGSPYYNLTYWKVTHGTVTDGPFQVDEEVTIGSVTLVPKYVDTSYFLAVNASDTVPTSGTATGGTSTATATVTGAEKLNGAIVTDDSSGTTLYTVGTDYNIDYQAGQIRALSGGSISTSCFVSADYPALTINTLHSLSSSSEKGELIFTGTSEQGPRLDFTVWSCSLTLTSPLQLITEAQQPISISAEMLSDAENHPNSPYMDLRHIA